MAFSVPDGTWPIFLTPFTDDNEIDFAALDSLLDFYISVGVDGLLALGQASEVLTLSYDECFAVAERLVTRCQGRLPLVIVGNFGDKLDEQAASLKRMIELGYDNAVVGLSLLPSPDQLDEQLLALAEKTGPDVPLGIYELPEPEHRLLTPEEVKRVAQSGRYFFMKDTCRQIEPFTAKVNAASGTALKLFQANLKVLPPSMQAGSHGFCGWMPIVAPELCAQVVDIKNIAPEVRQKAYEVLMDFQTTMVDQGFPASAKHILARRGVNIKPHSRVPRADIFSPEGAAILDKYLSENRLFEPIPVN